MCLAQSQGADSGPSLDLATGSQCFSIGADIKEKNMMLTLSKGGKSSHYRHRPMGSPLFQDLSGTV